MHLDNRALDAVAADAAHVARKMLRHVDACVACRRGFLERGGSDSALSAAIASARPRNRVLVAAASLAVLAGATAAAPPLRGAATSMLATFERHRVAAVPLTLDDMRSFGALPDLSAYATTRELVRSSQADFHDARAAAAAVRLAIREPSRAILGLRPLAYHVQSASAQLVTFDTTARARTTHVASATALPADIAGTTLRVDLGPVVVATYDTRAAAADRQRLHDALGRARLFGAQPRGRAYTVMVLAPPRSQHVQVVSSYGAGHRPSDVTNLPLVVVQMPVPRVSSTGASVQRIAQFMLDRPGVSPRLAAAFRALGDLSTTLPIPVPIDKAYTQPVAVDGVQGVGLGDDTGIGAAVIWQKNGTLYAVFAPRTARDVLAIANSLG